MEEYYAYHTAAVSLRVVCRRALKAQIKNIKAPKGKKSKVTFELLGRQYKGVLWPLNIEYLLDNLAEYQAKEAVKDIPLRNPSGCSFSQMWEAYKERYREKD